MAPELISTGKANWATDVYAFGVIRTNLGCHLPLSVFPDFRGPTYSSRINYQGTSLRWTPPNDHFAPSVSRGPTAWVYGRIQRSRHTT